MITKEQLLEIENYLILYRLPLDILIEVQDHMATQIVELQNEKNIPFEKAFFETKLAWEAELKPTKFRAFFPEEVPLIVKKLVKAKYWSLIKRAALLTSIGVVINFLAVFVSPTAFIYEIFFRIFNGLFLLIPLILWYKNKEIRKYFKEDSKYRGRSMFTMYQQALRMMFTNSFILIQVIRHDGSYFYNFLMKNENSSLLGFILTLIIPFIAQLVVVFGMLVFNEHKKTIHKIKHFIAE